MGYLYNANISYSPLWASIDWDYICYKKYLSTLSEWSFKIIISKHVSWKLWKVFFIIDEIEDFY